MTGRGAPFALDAEGLARARALFTDPTVMLTREDAAELDPHVRPGHLYHLVRVGELSRVNPQQHRVRLYRRAP